MRIYLTGLLLLAPYLIHRSVKDWEDVREHHSAELEGIPEKVQLGMLWATIIVILAAWPVAVMAVIANRLFPGLLGEKDLD